MKFNLDEKLEKKNEFYYGAKINKSIVDVYLGKGYLEPKESKRKLGAARGHEEILYIANGTVSVTINDEESTLEVGELIHIPDRSKALVSNLTNERVYFIIAGGHTKLHKH